jgi:flagellar biosynthesis/type III secretory pathway protein FliH
VSDLDIDQERVKLSAFTKEQLIEICIGLKCDIDNLKSCMHEGAEAAYQAGGAKGYTEGYSDGMERYANGR